MPAIVLTLALAYLIGSIPFGYLVVRFFSHQDIRETGSGNIGATNVARSGKKGLAALTLALDAFKGYSVVWIAAYVALHFCGDTSRFPALAVTAAVVGVLANIFPVWLRFKGGKGIATALGVFLALVPWTALAALSLFIVVVALTRYVSLGSILAAISIAPFTVLLYRQHTLTLLLGESIISLVTVLRHGQNIRRLIGGTESRFGSKNSE
jgi:glycerol-3-phosphate acyltransferase PlsY